MTRVSENNTTTEPAMKGFFGPWTVFTIAVLGMMLVGAFVTRSEGIGYQQYFSTGILVGLTGACAIWVFSERCKRKLPTLICLQGVTILAALAYRAHMQNYNQGLTLSPAYTAAIVLLFLAHTALVLMLTLSGKLGLSRWNRQLTYDLQQYVPRFSVSHLLAVMFVVALISILIHTAQPELVRFTISGTIKFLCITALLPIIAGLLFVNHRPSLMRFAVFAGITISLCFSMKLFVPTVPYPVMLLAQSAVLAFATIVPQFDR